MIEENELFVYLEEVGLRSAAHRYGINTEGKTTEEVIDAVERAGCCDAEAVIGAVLGGADYPVLLPGMTQSEFARRWCGVK